MRTHLQHGDGCVLTAAACVLDVTPLALYETLDKEVGSMVHIQELIRLLLNWDYRPVLLEYEPRFGDNPPLELPFWEYFHRGVLCTETHAYAHDDEIDPRFWDTNGKWVDELVPIFGIAW